MTPAPGTTPKAVRSSSGFTLIELMIAVAVVAILAAIAYPTFLDQIRKGRRSDAMTALNAVAQAQERWRANNPAYTSNLTAAPTASPGGLGLPSTSSNGYYTIAIDSSSATGYEVSATAVSGKSQANDGACAKLAMRMSAGNLESGSAASGSPTFSSTDRCWSR